MQPTRRTRSAYFKSCDTRLTSKPTQVASPIFFGFKYVVLSSYNCVCVKAFVTRRIDGAEDKAFLVNKIGTDKTYKTPRILSTLRAIHCILEDLTKDAIDNGIFMEIYFTLGSKDKGVMSEPVTIKEKFEEDYEEVIKYNKKNKN
ncbi:hypothetical protein PUN28_008277 [Cardiocondyla obscurior]|uniref:Uncharacterized protein n=1 Tax=Cardiocondyla obscurior TaxID=286306 RepID=A0AAW2G329_9HYME